MSSGFERGASGARFNRSIEALVAGALVSACASLVGLEESDHREIDGGVADSSSVDEATTGPVVEQPDAGCVGAGCACTGDSDCSPPFARCAGGRCAECVSDPDSCPTGRHCQASANGGVNECAVGCKADSDCLAISPAAPFCNLTRHQCVACRTLADCTGTNTECSPAGICAEKCTGAGGTCATPGQQCCNGLCVDVTSDILNCNGCQLACPGASPLCCAGQCKSSQTSADACGACNKTCKAATGAAICSGGSCLPSSCADILLTNPQAATGVYVVDPDGTGTASAFSVLCDMTTAGGGWTLVGRERPNTTGTFRFVAVDTQNPSQIASGTQSGLIGQRFRGKYTQVGITWSTASFIRFTLPQGFDFFANSVDTSVQVSQLTTSDASLQNWVQADNGAKVCIASRYSNVRPGDTSWAIKPRNDNNTNCGCNSGSWQGRGAFYGGTSAPSQTACDGYGGGWAGVRDNGAEKGGIRPSYETLLWIK